MKQDHEWGGAPVRLFGSSQYVRWPSYFSGAYYDKPILGLRWQRLDNIDLYEKTGPNVGEGHKSQQINFYYNEEGDRADDLKESERLFLTKVSFSSNFSSPEKSYSFEYHNYKNVRLYLDDFVDYWGYDKSFDLLDKYPNGILTRINYPTGGCSIFEYEANRYKRYIDKSFNKYEHCLISSCWSLDNPDFFTLKYTADVQQAGGLRIKRITDYDIDNASMNGTFKIFKSKKEYSYKKMKGALESGILYTIPMNTISFNAKVYPQEYGYENEIAVSKNFITPIIPLSNSSGYHIGYSNVTEIRFDAVGTAMINEYEYTNYEGDILEEFRKAVYSTIGSTEINYLSSDFSFPDLDYMTGKLKKQTTYSYLDNKDITEIIEYKYSDIAHTHFKSNYSSLAIDMASFFIEANMYEGTGQFRLWFAKKGNEYKRYYQKYDVIKETRTYIEKENNKSVSQTIIKDYIKNERPLYIKRDKYSSYSYRGTPVGEDRMVWVSQLHKEIVTDQTGNVYETLYRYPTDIFLQNQNSELKELENQFRIGSPVEIRKTINGIAAGAERVTFKQAGIKDSMRYCHCMWTSCHPKYEGILEYQNILVPSKLESSPRDINSMTTEYEFLQYDKKGNLLTYKGRDQVPKTIIWDYGKRKPAMLIDNITYDEAALILGEDLQNIVRNSNTDWSGISVVDNFFEKFKAQNKDVKIKHYKYTPSSQVEYISGDFLGSGSKFTYDKFDRLQMIESRKLGVMNEFEYKFRTKEQY
ncbi:hypothetical protein [Dysgonomonas sp. 216]|uniref:hypothetical protein n=1 Tax=Dysgonomonas sp. 216 TaxID=2302934 RepID=UPI0013D70DA8|nr:hypothetical protein [Dysgonomonas sp. 216]